MGQNEGKKCKNVRESSTRSKRQELTANVGYLLLEILPVTDTSEILSRTGLKSVGNASRGFEQVGLAVYTVLMKKIKQAKQKSGSSEHLAGWSN